MHVAVMGAGSLGSLIGGLLATKHRVTLVGRQEHMRAIAAEGLQMTGLIERTVHPATTTSWDTLETPDLAVVTVKSYDTATAGEAIARKPPSRVLTLQNGLGNVETLRTALPDRCTVLAGTVTYGAIQETSGAVRCTGRGTVTIGSPEGGRSPPAEEIAAAFRETPLMCEAAAEMPRLLWEKVAINAAINPVTALARVRNGAILEKPLRPIASAATREVVRVARRQGIDLDMEDTLERLETVARQTSENTSSMAQDLIGGSETEIEAITGAVIRRAEPEQVPVNRVLYGLIVANEWTGDGDEKR